MNEEFRNNGGVMRGGIIGFGGMGRLFAQLVREHPEFDAEIVGVCDRCSHSLQVAADAFGLFAAHDAAELLAQDLDFVLIATQSNAHAHYVEEAAAAGCHVLCEKPIALSLEDADRMIAAAERAGVISVVNYSMRFNIGYMRIKEMVESGEFGSLLAVTHSKTRGFGLNATGAKHPAVEEPEESGGWTVHHACHDLDFLYWIGGPIKRVSALVSSTVTEKDSEEVVLGLVEFESGAIGSVGDSVCGIRDHYTRIIGSAASLVMTEENEHSVCRFHKEGANEDVILPVQDRKRPGKMLEHFFECIRKNTPSPISLRDGRPSLEAALAMKQSALTGAPVELEHLA
jgi:predicted dehydrogenase